MLFILLLYLGTLGCSASPFSLAMNTRVFNLSQLMYTPEMALITLTALKFAHRPDHMAVAGALHAFAWIAQFVGHGFAEKRAPALMDNILGGLSNLPHALARV